MPPMISVEDAWAILDQHRLPERYATCPLQEATGLTLSKPVVAALNQPPHAVSAMDGYAVHLEDVRKAGAELKVIGEAPAGHPFGGSVGTGEAVRIFTGAHVPAGADHIMIQEDTAREDAKVICKIAQTTARFIRPKGLDFAEGDVLLAAGTRLTPQRTALAAAGNVAIVSVVQRPRIGVMANGDELKPAGTALNEGEIVNSVSPALCGLITGWGGDAVDLGIVPDSPEQLSDHIREAADLDLIVTIGGASVGDHDHMKSAFLSSGFETVFSKIAVRPGKPTWFAKASTQFVLGLPGNPASALVCANLFLKPLVTREPVGCITARVSTSLPQNGDREHFMRASIKPNTDGSIIAFAHDNQDSSLLSPFRNANALIRRAPNAPALPAGDVAECILLSNLLNESA